VSALDRFKKLFSTGDPDSDPDRPFVCRGCGERYEVEYYTCPACGGFSVERPLGD
jgi:ribosomal protein L37E